MGKTVAKYLIKNLLLAVIFVSLSTSCMSILSGSTDVVVIDTLGKRKSSPFRLRFGALQTLSPTSKDVKIFVDDRQVNFTMKLNNDGDAYFPGNEDPFTPTEDQLNLMGLNFEENKFTAQIETGFLKRTKKISLFIYVWDHLTKIAVSDIDGTITRSDVFGLILPFFGIDWSQKNIVKLYQDVITQGYKILYLTARAIGESSITRDYLNGLTQDGIYLPNGPVVTSPDDVITSIKREVITKDPQSFKIPFLKNITSLYPENATPIYAGFGNRDTDAQSYAAVNVTNEKTYIVNEQGEVRSPNSTIVVSYLWIDQNIDHLFPKTH